MQGPLKYYSTDFFDQHGDPRVAAYPLMRTPWPVAAMCLAYLAFVKRLGPAYMKDRKPFELFNFIRLYNLAMVLWQAFGFYMACQLLNYGLDTFGCRPIDDDDRSPRAAKKILYGYIFLVSRLVEFTDTICFVLRKKSRQISAFHVFHHFTVPLVVWFFFKFAPGGNSAIFPFINTAVHTIMYSYYFLATFPAARPYLGWKKYLTQMQIVQFLIIIACCLQPMFIPGCKVPKALLLVIIGFSFVFIYLFVDFYLKAYRQSHRRALGGSASSPAAAAAEGCKLVQANGASTSLASGGDDDETRFQSNGCNGRHTTAAAQVVASGSSNGASRHSETKFPARGKEKVN